MNVIESFTTLNGYSRAREILFERPVQNSKTTVLPCANTIAWRLQTNKFRLIEFPSSPRPKSGSDPQLFSLAHVLCLASDVQRAQPRYRVDKFLAFCARLDDAHQPILTGEHFLHSTQTLLTVRGILNNEHYNPVVYASCVRHTQRGITPLVQVLQ